jgi:hypothetical protein
MCTECTQGYELHLHKVSLDLDYDPAGEVLITTWTEPTVPEPYRAILQVFFEGDTELMPSNNPQDMATEPVNS